MIITKGLGSNLLITIGYGFGKIIKTEIIKLNSYISRIINLKSKI